MLKIQKYEGYQRGLAFIVYKFLDKKLSGSGMKNEIKQNQQLANELHQAIIKKIRKIKVYSSFKGNICGADLDDLKLISTFNKEIRFLMLVIDIYSKYAWVVSLKDKKGVTIVNAF